MHQVDMQAPYDIAKILDGISRDREVHVLYACESGSRIWNMASHDSDYDVRFIYAHPMDHYIRIDKHRDVIEMPLIDGKYDVSGWDIRKALGLFQKLNVAMFEWLFSPVRYWEIGNLAAMLRKIAVEHYKFPACAHHYYHMAKRNYREYCQSDVVRHKKYLYVLRPLATIRWMEAVRTFPPPADIEEVVSGGFESYGDEFLATVAGLLQRKRAGDELGKGPRIDVLNHVLDAEFALLDDMLYGGGFPKPTLPDRDAMNDILRGVLRSC